jgi:hypothetical protein
LPKQTGTLRIARNHVSHFGDHPLGRKEGTTCYLFSSAAAGPASTECQRPTEEGQGERGQEALGRGQRDSSLEKTPWQVLHQPILKYQCRGLQISFLAVPRKDSFAEPLPSIACHLPIVPGEAKPHS